MNIKESLGTKVGPLPMAAWGGIAIVLIIIVSSMRKGKTGNTTSSGANGNSVDTVGYLDANGNPIVPIWSNLPMTPPVISTVQGPVATKPKTPTPSRKIPAPKLPKTPIARKPPVKTTPHPHTPTHSGSVHAPKGGSGHGKMAPSTHAKPAPVARNTTPSKNTWKGGGGGTIPAKPKTAGEHSGSRIRDL
jgi:hypothetical protein